MKKLTAVFLTIFFVLVFAFSVSASGTSKTRQITGSVSAVDTVNNTVTVRKKNLEVTLNMDAGTKVAQCEGNASIDNISVGDKVTASYKETENSNTAKSITVTKASN
jgi:Cu/Ag efflux protein CusF